MAAGLAWAIGAQDVSNCFGTSVGSKALTILQSCILAGICEFLGSLAGGQVSTTISGGLLDMPLIVSMGHDGAVLYARIMASAMAGALGWLVLATRYSLPVSTSHSLVGGIVGLGLYATGTAKWTTVAGIGESTTSCQAPCFESNRFPSNGYRAGSPKDTISIKSNMFVSPLLSRTLALRPQCHLGSQAHSREVC